MPDAFISFTPLVVENIDSVRARMNADANAGLDPADPNFQDTTEGGFFWDMTQAAAMEAVRLWDLLGTETVAAAFPGTAWGDYLDLHGETINVPRLDEVQSTGIVLFTGAIGTLIPSGTQVATVQADPSSADAPVTFLTDRSITLVDTPGPTNLAATPSGSGGTLPAGVYYYMVTAIGANGETIASNEVMVTLSGATSSVALAWTASAGATAYKIYRGATPLSERLLASPVGTGTTYTDTGAVSPGATVVPTNSVSVTAQTAGTVGNVPAGSITQVLTPITGGPAVTNAAAASGGADVESDQRFRTRILAAYASAPGAGNIAAYVKWALDVPQIGYVTVQPLWNGPGTVRVIVTDRSNKPVTPSVVANLQTILDPVAGMGNGLAPIGAIVTVTTATSLAIAIAATITHSTGYSLDGAGGTIATRAAITQALSDYVNTLTPGSNVILNKVIGQFFLVPGVLDVSGVTLNGSAANVTVGGLQVPSLTLPPTLS
jgi:uncharacterized phage protein gp47/JayE